jgi:hypothetical protein
MRNKPYVVAVLIPALVSTWWAISLLLGDNTILALVVAGGAAALGFVAVRIAKAESFAPTPKASYKGAVNDNVKRWLKVQDDDATTAEAAANAPSAAASQIRRQ